MKRKKSSKKKRGRTAGQPRIITALDEIGARSGYFVQKRGKDRQDKRKVKVFYPDVIARPIQGKRDRVFEVEATITNNTIYKSLVSLLHNVAGKKKSEGYLVVPDRRNEFVRTAWKVLQDIIGSYAPKRKGAPRKIPIGIITFDEVLHAEKKMIKWFDSGRVGQPPKVAFLPRH